MIKSLSFVLLIFGLAGCGGVDKEEVSEENFTVVLNEYYKQHCIKIYTGEIPKEIDPKGILYNPIEKFKALEEIGLLSSSNVEIKSHFGKIIDGKKFVLTQKGKDIYTDTSDAKGFCVGHYKVDKLENYTEPSSVRGMTVSRVQYDLKISKMTPLLKKVMDTKVLAEPIIKQMKSKKFSKTVLVLTSMKGWIHERDFKK